MAASNFKAKMTSHFRSSNSFSRSNTNSNNYNSSDGANERTGLLQSHIGFSSNSNGTKWYEDSRPWVSYPAAFFHTTWEVLLSNYANVLLVFVPLGIVFGALGKDPVTVFILNFLAIVPLAGLLSFATEELSAKLGQTIGGLMNATFGNAVELIVSIVALNDGQIRIVQSSMLGSILSNILLVLGCCFVSSGIKRQEGLFNVTIANTMSSLMAVAVTALIIPAALYASLKDGPDNDGQTQENILVVSRGTSIIMLFLYVLYLYFQLRSHASLFNDVEAGEEEDEPESGENGGGESHERKEGDTLAPIPAGIALILITICVAVCAEYLVDSIDAIVERAHISKTFIGLILLPIVGNAAEHVTAVVVSFKGKMNLALGVAIGSSMQIALFVTPFLVLLGWAMHQEMTLHFETFETVVFFLSVLVVNYLIQDGKSNYLEGCMCIGTYLIIALAFYVMPEGASSSATTAIKQWFSSSG